MLIISEKQTSEFLNELKNEFDVFDIRGEALPIKKYFFPPMEDIFSISEESGKITSSESSDEMKKEFVIFGPGLQDLEALTQLDEIMKKPNEDFFYLQKRERSIVIGLIKEEVDVAQGGDIVFQEIGGGYKALTNTKKGEELIEKHRKFFKEIKEPETDVPQIPTNESLDEWPRSMRKLLIDPELLAKAVEWSRGHKIWKELKEKCLGCGICTYVCPLCHCFSIEDSVGLNGKRSRCRKWDACTLPEFAKIAGGHNFRPTIKERYYNWFYHKFVRAYKEYGKSQCVGCGRCKKLCPAGIDIKEVLSVIIKGYKKSL